MNPLLLLWPMVIHALVTLFLYVPMSRARVASVKSGKVKAGVYRLNTGEPEESLQFSNAIRNQNEIGVLFYAACLTLYATDGASWLTAALAWIFVISKCAHVLIHVTTNRLRFRRPVFSVAWLMVIALWIVAGLHFLRIA
jgi:hypothetical protein